VVSPSSIDGCVSFGSGCTTLFPRATSVRHRSHFLFDNRNTLFTRVAILQQIQLSVVVGKYDKLVAAGTAVGHRSITPIANVKARLVPVLVRDIICGANRSVKDALTRVAAHSTPPTYPLSIRPASVGAHTQPSPPPLPPTRTQARDVPWQWL